MFRESFSGEIWENPLLWRLSSYCIAKAAHKPQEFVFRNVPQPIKIDRAQFVTGRKSLHREIFPKPDDYTPSESTVWRGLERLETLKVVNRCMNSLFTIVTVCNYDLYDFPEIERGQVGDHKQSSDSDALNIKKSMRSDKRQKNISSCSASGRVQKFVQKYFAWVTVDDVTPMAWEVFRAAKYHGDDGAFFWRAAGAVYAGLYPECHVIGSATAAGALGKNKPAYARSTLAEALGKPVGVLDEELRSIRFSPFLPKKSPEGL